jgi:signal transduction histidine kinase
MNPFRELGLAGRLSVLLTLTLVPVGGAVTYGIIKVQEEHVLAQADAEQLLRLDLARRTLESAMLRKNPKEIQSFLDSLVDGQVVTDAGIFDAASQQEVFAAHSEKIGSAAEPGDLEALLSEGQVTRPVGEDRLRTVVRIPNQPACQSCHDPDRAVLGGFYIETSDRSTRAVVAGLRTSVLVLGAFLLLLQSAVVFGVVRRVVHKPLDKLIHVVERVEKGDLSARIQHPGTDELARLAAATNTMIESLARSREELEKTHANHMERAERLANLGRLAASLAHEIKNPLAGMDGALRVLSEREHFTSDDRRIITMVGGQIERIDRTVEQLLSFARPAPLRLTLASPAEVLDRSLALIQQRAEQDQIDLQKSYSDAVPSIHMDPQQVQQAFLNVLLNSMDALCPGGRIRVDLSLENEASTAPWIRVSIEDDGSGIPREALPFIFEPFFTTKVRGTGLGLAVSRNIVQAHDGEIEVESEPGKGSHFVVRLPARSRAEVGIAT